MTSMQITNFNVREEIGRILQDPYVKKCVGKPEIPEHCIEVLEILFLNDPFEPIKKHRLGIAALLLQMGLEMHNRVSIHQNPTPTEMKVRQQQVLAGDYYSSLFYRFLAQKQDVSMIRYFSRQVLRINEAKISLHNRLIHRCEYDQEMLSFLKKVTSGLLIAVADFFHVQDEFVFLWKETTELYLLIMDLIKNKEWEKIPASLRLQLFQEWSDLISRIQEVPENEWKSQLLAVLRRHETFMEKIAVKES